MQVHKSFFMVGVYDGNQNDQWPWHCHYDEGVYLSTKKRRCTQRSAAEFDCIEDARAHYHSWKNRDKYKLEIIEYKRWIEIEDPEFPADHPRSILKRIKETETGYIRHQIAFCWFLGFDITKIASSKRLKTLRKDLIKYGIDIGKPPETKLEPLISEENETWHTQKHKASIRLIDSQ